MEVVDGVVEWGRVDVSARFDAYLAAIDRNALVEARTTGLLAERANLTVCVGRHCRGSEEVTLPQKLRM